MKKNINRSVYVEARLWFDKTGGNTYHSIRLWVDGAIVGVIPMTYGYDGQYENTAKDALVELGYISGDRSVWLEAQTQGFDYYTSEAWGKKSELFKGSDLMIVR